MGADIDTDVLAPGHAMKHGIDLGPVPPLYAICPDTSATIAPERTT